MVKERSSKKERRVDALALRADERRDKLRKAAGRSKYPLIRRCLNGETRMSTPHASIRQSITYGGEPPELKHLSRARKRKKNSISKVAASEMERGQTGVRACRGLDRGIDSVSLMERFWESLPKRVKAPYMKTAGSGRIQSTARHEKPCGKSEGPPSKAKYSLVTDSA